MMRDLVEPDKSPDIEAKLSETLDIGMKAIDKVHFRDARTNTIDNLQMRDIEKFYQTVSWISSKEQIEMKSELTCLGRL